LKKKANILANKYRNPPRIQTALCIHISFCRNLKIKILEAAVCNSEDYDKITIISCAIEQTPFSWPDLSLPRIPYKFFRPNLRYIHRVSPEKKNIT